MLIDAVSAAEGVDASDASTLNLAFQRLTEIEGAFHVKVQDGGPDSDLDIELDLSNLLGGTIVTMTWLIHQIASAQGVSPDSVIIELRHFLDS